MDAVNTLKKSKADLKNVRENLEEMMKARDSAVFDLAGVMKQAED